ncbi:adaptin domain protein [Oesophagostomum dentatum]|uniref:Adaptin domain protein n=1 Tax=Oesophagostomum dentatum TaxID=61180 RepID=A0A0B1TPW9_OESDE|nr:adaptin domain protein [Oesophagostomum dentatum]
MTSSTGLDDLLGLGGPSVMDAAPPAPAAATFDPLANLGLGGPVAPTIPSSTAGPASLGGLGDIFSGSLNLSEAVASGYQAPKQLWLDAARGKGTQIDGTFVRRGGAIYMEMTFTNKAMQALSGFAIQFNKNSFGLVPAEPLRVPSPLMPGQSANVSMRCDTTGAVQKMEPLTNLQVRWSCAVFSILFCFAVNLLHKTFVLLDMLILDLNIVINTTCRSTRFSTVSHRNAVRRVCRKAIHCFLF